MGDFIQESYKSPFIALLFVFYLFLIFRFLLERRGWKSCRDKQRVAGSTPLNKLSNAVWYT
jgi:hypothetical protein